MMYSKQYTMSDIVMSNTKQRRNTMEQNNLQISEFKGEYRFLSNFYQHPFEFEGLTYPNAEAAFQAQKCRNSEDNTQK